MNYRKYLVSEAVSDAQKKLAKDFEKTISKAIAGWVEGVKAREPDDMVINQSIQLGWRMVHPLQHAAKGRKKA